MKFQKNYNILSEGDQVMDTNLDKEIKNIDTNIEKTLKKIEEYYNYRKQTDKVILSLLANIYRELRRSNERFDDTQRNLKKCDNDGI